MNPDAEAVAIRHMTAADLAAVQALAGNLPEAPHWPPSAYHDAIDPAATRRRIALVAVEPTSCTVRGFAVASLLPPQAELETIAVAAANRRQGLGQKLFRSLAAKLQAAGVSELLLEVRASNRPALAFYQTLGFVRTGLRPGYYTDPIEDALLMRLPLAAESA